MSDEIVEAAFRAAVDAIDEAWRLVREHRRASLPYSVDTLSTSLAEPLAYSIEQLLSNARFVVKGDTDRAALLAITRVCQERGLISDLARDRLLKDLE